MLGYLDDPAATAEAIDADGWLHTGDVGRLDEDGNLTITDRLKDMYISGGFNVYPAEVEQALARLDGVVDAAVVGVPDERLGEVGKAYVVRRGRCPARRRRRDRLLPGTAGQLQGAARRGVRRRAAAQPLRQGAEERVAGSRQALRAFLNHRRDADGPRPHRRRAGLPRRGPAVAGRERAGGAAAVDGHGRGVPSPTRRGRRASPRPGGRWCPGRGATTAGTRRWSSGCSSRRSTTAPARPAGSRQNGIFLLAPIALRPRHPGAAGPLPALDGHRRAGLGAGLVRARGRLRPGLPHAPARAATRPGAAGCSTARRPGRRARPSPTGASGCSASGPPRNRAECPAAPGPDLLPVPARRRRHHGPADRAARRRGRVRRALLPGRLRARLRRARGTR